MVGTTRQVVCVETGHLYNSLHEAANLLGLKRHGIGRVCRGLQPKTGGLSFRYATDEDLAIAQPRTKWDCVGDAVRLAFDVHGGAQANACG